MKYIVALAACAAAVAAQIPDGCQTNFDGPFLIAATNISGSPGQNDKRQVTPSQLCGDDDTAVITLKDSVLKDASGRTGAIVANAQFQFDNPVQKNSQNLDGFSICSNGSLAVAGSAIFYQCLSGTFYNLYNANPLNGKQCNEVTINALACDANAVIGSGSATPSSVPVSTPSSASSPATSATDVVITSTTAPAPVVTPTTAAAPFPVPSNGTAPAPTASGTGAPAPGPSAFVPGSGAATVIIGGNIMAAVAAIGAFAMF